MESLNPGQTRDAWDDIAKGYDQFVTPGNFTLGEDALRKAGLRPGMKFLDVAAGSGGLSIPAARLGARVLATDLSPRMLDQLRARATQEGLTLETRAMDGHALDLPSDSFDMAGSQFGVMLFPDMRRGLRELARVVKPGGVALMVVFGSLAKIEFFSFFVRAIEAAIPGFSGPPETPLPFQLQDPEKLRQEMIKAGLEDVRVEQTSASREYQSGSHLWDWLMNSNPVTRMIVDEVGLTPEKIRVVQQALDRMVRERAAGRDAAVLTSAINIGIGTK
jgi:ubiquinone/menaquinone biosynthesis C-methylase UbiE